MSICLCNLSADTVLELAAQNKLELTPASPDMLSFRSDLASVREALGELITKLPRPIELLVGNAKERRPSKEIACHTWRGSMPGSNFLQLDEGVYVSGPEFVLLQQASQLHQANLCQMLGRYLGTWTPAPDKERGMKERAPLTTLESLSRFVASTGRVMGKNNLKLAMAHTCDGAASAPEASFQLALCLPPELYGLGLPFPTMNFKVDLSSQAKKLYPHDSIRIDLCWRDARFGLEYQGEDHGKQLGEDYARWFAAREEDYELWFVAKEQLEDAKQMGHIGREVAKRIGLDTSELHWPSEAELQDLLDILSGRVHPKPVSYNELRRRRALLS